MLECVNGNGQGACDLCMLIKGWSCEWSSWLYYVKNEKGLYLRKVRDRCYFDSDSKFPKAAFCHEHALIVEQERMSLNDWHKSE